MSKYKKIGIIGAGCYGTAIAQCFSKRVANVCLLSNSQKIADNINKFHTTPVLEGVILNKNISCAMNYANLKDRDVIFIVVPVNAVKSVCVFLKNYEIDVPVVLCSKGVDVANARLMSMLVEDIITNDIAVFSGPSFAHEIASGLPFGVNIASKNSKLSAEIGQSLSCSQFIVKSIDDYIGLQVAGAFKNILAIGCGMMSEMRRGSNAIAQFIVNGLHEMMDLSVTLGGMRETLFELGGIGDIILTCTNEKSRNVLFGKHIAAGGKIDNWTGDLAEGVFSAKAIPLFEKKYNIQLKVFSEIYKSIYS